MLVSYRNTDRFSSADFPSSDEFSRAHHTPYRYCYGYFQIRPQHVINRIYPVKTIIDDTAPTALLFTLATFHPTESLRDPVGLRTCRPEAGLGSDSAMIGALLQSNTLS